MRRLWAQQLQCTAAHARIAFGNGTRVSKPASRKRDEPNEATFFNEGRNINEHAGYLRTAVGLGPIGCAPDISTTSVQPSRISPSSVAAPQPPAASSSPFNAAPHVLASATDLGLIMDIVSDGAQLYFGGGHECSTHPVGRLAK